MLKNYWLVALRNIRRSKIYSLINVAGLAIGLASVMLIVLYVKDELSFDRFHPKIHQLYRIVSEAKFDGQQKLNSHSGFLQGPGFASHVPGIRAFVRIQNANEDFKLGQEVKSESLLYVDSNFFSLFHFPLLEGNDKTCLQDPYSIVLSRKAAIKQFGTSNALGKIVMIRRDSAFIPYRVTGVAADCPENSSIQFNILLPFRAGPDDLQNKENWFNFFLNTFVLLDPGANIKQVETQMQQYYESEASTVFKEMVARYGIGDAVTMGRYFLQPMADIHLNPELPAQNGLEHPSNPVYSYILSGIAIFILLIACINFINLTVARSIRRSREIGVRKVIGGSRAQLVIQFLGESFLLCVMAFVIAILLLQFSLPFFNRIANKQLSLSYLFDGKLILAYILLLLLTGFLAGFYPALVLSGLKPVDTLYSRFVLPGKNYLQKSLVVIQFALASFLIIGTFIIYAQFNFLTHANLGYDDTHVLTVEKANLSRAEATLFRHELLANPDIMQVSAKNGGQWSTAAKLSSDSNIQFSYETIDEDYLPLLKVPVVQGRNFSKDFPSDPEQSVLVNEAFVRQAGWKNPVGESVIFAFRGNKVFHVIGVVKDYHFLALNEKIKPQLFTMTADNGYGIMWMRIRPGSETSVINYVHTLFRKLFPMNPFSYNFKDEENRRSYEAEQRWKQILLFAALLTIFISCIGLFGLSVLSAEKRTKEIGIRKVLGASVNQLAGILSFSFLKLVLLAFLIAFPLSWLAANRWLENYPYRIQLEWGLFAAAGILILLIALVTVSYQAIRAARANPVRSLRTE
jgi:putative ABC transport system permease protein